MIRVLLADDQAMVRHGFAMILRAVDDVEVVGEASDGHEAVRMTAELAPDVVLMDVRMPGRDGIEATREIVAAGGGSRVLILTTFDTDEIVLGALRAGASGFLLKDSPGDQLVSAIRVVADGSSLFSPAVTRRLIERFVSSQPTANGDLEALTSREREVMTEVAKGYSNREVAERIYLSEHTVRTHVAHLLDKLGLRDRTQLVVRAYESGLVRPGSDAAP